MPTCGKKSAIRRRTEWLCVRQKGILDMEKTRCRLNICGVEVTVAGDMEREAAEQIAEAVRSRMQRVLSTAYAASVEKAAVITAMNLCEELARKDVELQANKARVAELERELKQIGGADGLKMKLSQVEGKLKLAQEQLSRVQSARHMPNEAAQPAKTETVKTEMRNPLRPDLGDQTGLVSFFAKE